MLRCCDAIMCFFSKLNTTHFNQIVPLVRIISTWYTMSALRSHWMPLHSTNIPSGTVNSLNFQCILYITDMATISHSDVSPSHARKHSHIYVCTKLTNVRGAVCNYVERIVYTHVLSTAVEPQTRWLPRGTPHIYGNHKLYIGGHKHRASIYINQLLSVENCACGPPPYTKSVVEFIPNLLRMLFAWWSRWPQTFCAIVRLLQNCIQFVFFFAFEICEWLSVWLTSTLFICLNYG